VIVVGMLQLAYKAPHAGLALSTALSALIQSWLLYRGLVKEGVYRPDPGWLSFLVKILLACGVMSIVLYYGVADMTQWETWKTLYRVWQLLLWVAVGGGVYFLSLIVLGVKPVQMFMRHGGHTDED